MTHTHKATDHLCPFYIERNNKRNITMLLATIRTHRLEGYENPFGLTNVRRASQTSGSQSSYDASRHVPHTGNFPTQFLTEATFISSQDSNPSFRLSSSNDSLFRHVPDITASHTAAATITEIQDSNSTL